MREKKLIEAAEDSPTRCQAVHAHGQCQYEAEPGLKFCARHKGMLDSIVKRKNIRNYRLTKFRAEIEEKADSAGIKSLREEIGITRQVLESFINKCEDETDLMIHSNKISDLVLKIEKLVTSCHRLEKSTSQLLDKTALIQVAGYFVEIIGEYVNDEEQAEIADRLIETIKNIEIKDD